MNNEHGDFPKNSNVSKLLRAGLNLAGVIPYAGSILSTAASAWSEHEQDKINSYFKYWLEMLQDELREKEKTIIEIMQRLDVNDEKISERIKSPEYQSLIKKSFRNWSSIENENKREYVRNILANAAACNLSTDDVVRLFIDWVNEYSVLHFQVIACIYRHPNGINRGEIWNKIGKKQVREDSSDADLYKLLIRDLSTGGIIRQHRQTDYYGNFVKQQPIKKLSPGSSQLTSAFDREDLYVLTALGADFVHYAMTEVPIKITYTPNMQEA